MLLNTFALLIVLSMNICNVYLSTSTKSHFEFTKEAQDALCPFVGTEGMQCFDGEPIQFSDRELDTDTLKLPRGVGISIDRSTGRLKALAVQLTYSTDTGRIWTDGFTGQTFDIYNEVILGSANKASIAYNASRAQIFRNASQLNAIWQQTFIDGKIRGGQLARPPDLFKYTNEILSNNNALVLFQSITGLYTLTINPSTIKLNPFAQEALSKLTPMFKTDLYEDFVDKWGTHVITKSLIGGMVDMQAKIIRCFHGEEHSLVIQCLPFEDRHLSNPACLHYNDQNLVISKRRLGGNEQAKSDREWKRTLAFGPAMLQILEMVPWYEFVRDKSVKENLHTIIWYRQKVMDSNQSGQMRFADAHTSSCSPVLPRLPANAKWQQYGTTVAGGNGQGGYNYQLNRPPGLFVVDDDDQTILVADSYNHRIIQFKRGDINGQVVAGGNGQGNRLDQLNHPAAVLIDRETNSLIIADTWNRRVMRWSRRNGTTQGEILIENTDCLGLTMDEQRNLYVSDAKAQEVKRYGIDKEDKKGTLVAGGNGRGAAFNQLDIPYKIYFHRNQSLYVSDRNNHRVMRWDKDAKEGVLVAGGQGGGRALTQLWYPYDIFLDNLDSLYVVEEWNDRVSRWSREEKQSTIVVGGNGRGSAANQFNEPEGLSFDKHGNLYVLEWSNNRVQRFSLIK